MEASMYFNIIKEQSKHDLTNKSLGAALGVSENLVRNWIEGTSPIPSEKIVGMCKMWGVSADYLLSRPQEKEMRVNT
jgi:plasmid maintenance system antidote protein VapI